MTNPFETEMESKIENFTTNSFKLTQMTTKNDESSAVAFGDSVEDLLLFRPVQITQEEINHTNNLNMDYSNNHKIQQKIGSFFSQSHIVPSPLNNKIMTRHKAAQANSVNFLSPINPNKKQKFADSPQKAQKAKQSLPNYQINCAQTDISLPLNFDLNPLLGNFNKN